MGIGNKSLPLVKSFIEAAKAGEAPPEAISMAKNLYGLDPKDMPEGTLRLMAAGIYPDRADKSCGMCDHCHFDGSWRDKGECRKNAPDKRGQWPMVSLVSFCGDFVEGEQQRHHVMKFQGGPREPPFSSARRPARPPARERS